ncbi:MAG: CAP domain-containing protein [Mucilaginibacter sp.]
MKRIILATVFLLITTLSFAQPRADEKFKNEFLETINHTRQKGCTCGTTYMPAVAPLTWNDMLENAAMVHAKDMNKHNYFSHTGKDGRSSSDRIMASGYTFDGYKSFAAGENIALGQQSIAEVMAGWFKSVGHCMNLMNPSFTEVGVARVNDYWVQDFGGREPFSDEQQKLIKSGRYRLMQKKVIRE